MDEDMLNLDLFGIIVEEEKFGIDWIFCSRFVGKFRKVGRLKECGMYLDFYIIYFIFWVGGY